jgi:hypothetical protein
LNHGSSVGIELRVIFSVDEFKQFFVPRKCSLNILNNFFQRLLLRPIFFDLHRNFRRIFIALGLGLEFRIRMRGRVRVRVRVRVGRSSHFLFASHECKTFRKRSRKERADNFENIVVGKDLLKYRK